MQTRLDGREFAQPRKVKITPDYLMYPQGSVLIELGLTKVICTATVEERTAGHLKGTGQGWVTAEYNMLPGATANRKKRDISKLRIDGRSQEIQRFIGRSLRKAVDMEALGERTIWIDCDVIQADGGTRTASITGAFIALCLACKKILDEGLISEFPIIEQISAISVGIQNHGQVALDLCYQEDSNAAVDMNVVMAGDGKFVEVQGTGELSSFSLDQLNEMISFASKGNFIMQKVQRACLEEKGIYLPKHEGKQIIAATRNLYKIREVEAITREFGMKVISRDDAGIPPIEIEETGETFAENSRLKAVEIMKLSGCISMADDSGLMVDYLAGAPGVYSARFAGEHASNEAADKANNQKLMELLQQVPVEKRGAKFVSVITLAYPDGRIITTRGECRGRIGFEPKGTNGFGYDPIFIPEGYEKTYAELTAEEKNKISHRAKALEELRGILSKGE